MSPDNDLLFAHSSTLVMSDFSNLGEFDSFAKDGMFLSNANEEIADGDLLISGLDGKDDLKPFLNCEVDDDAFGASLKGRDDDDANSVNGRSSQFTMFIDEDSSEPLEFMNMVAKLDSQDPCDGLDLQRLGLSSSVKDTLLSDSSEESVPPCHKALLAASELDSMSLTALDQLAHVDTTDALCAMPDPCSTNIIQRTIAKPATSALAALSPARAAPTLSKNLRSTEALSLCSTEMAASSVLQANSPTTSPSSTVSFRSSDGGALFNLMLRGDEASSKRCMKAAAIPQPAGALSVEAVRSAFGISSALQPQSNSSMQRSQSSHALGQLTLSSRVQGSFNDDEFSVPPSCKQEAPLSLITPSVSFLTPYPAACNTQGLAESSSSATPMRRVCSTGDLQAFHGTKKFYGGSSANTIAEEAACVKIGHYTVEERKLKLHRYRQKRTERNFSKKIKYACRKTLADSRPRVRGRFARTDEMGESSLRGSDLPLIDEYDEVTSHRPPRMVHDNHAYLMANNSCILSSSSIAQFWSTAGTKVAM